MRILMVAFLMKMIEAMIVTTKIPIESTKQIIEELTTGIGANSTQEDQLRSFEKDPVNANLEILKYLLAVFIVATILGIILCIWKYKSPTKCERQQTPFHK